MSKRKIFREMDEQEEIEALKTLQALEEAGEDPIQRTLDYFFTEGYITEILHMVKSGKEATVYCCRAHPSTGARFLAAKIYRSRQHRSFKNDAVYQEGRLVLDGHLRRAVKNKSRAGREAQFSLWLDHEFTALTTLSKAGARVPRVIARTESALLMDYLGDYQQPAPTLQNVILEREEVLPIFETLMDNVRLCLSYNYIHADLSPYNILYWEGQPTIIDFPQAVDPRFNSHSLMLLTRDIDNLCKYFGRNGLHRDAQAIANRLWRQFTNAEL